MKPAMAAFVRKNNDVLVNYTLVGTETTLKMIKTEMAEYDISGDLKLGAACSSGPYGGDAQLAAQIVYGNIGCLIFFVDPLTPHPHSADVESLLRLARVHEILLATNSMTASCVVEALRLALSDNTVMEVMRQGTSILSEAVAAHKKQRAWKASGENDAG